MSDLAPCDSNVFRHGEVFEIRDMRPHEAESRVAELRKSWPDSFFDWHYAAGRAVIKQLPKNWKAAKCREIAEELRVLDNGNGKLCEIADLIEAEPVANPDPSPESKAVKSGEKAEGEA